MTEEIWRPVVGYEGLYEVSSYGRVRSLDRYVKGRYGNYRLHKGKILSPAKDKNGYLKLVLSCNGKCKTINVHRLIAEAFIPNPDNLPEINHINEDKTDNRVDNLEWCTAKYNNNYGSRKDRVRDTLIKNGYYKTGLSRKDLGNIEYGHQYYHKNKDKAKEYSKKYYQENKDRICKRQKEYYRIKKAGL